MRIKNLVKEFPVKIGAFGEKSAIVHAVDGVSFDIFRGETLGLVGESGCGKSTTGFTLLQLYRPTSGEVEYNGVDLASLKEKELRAVRKGRTDCISGSVFNPEPENDYRRSPGRTDEGARNMP